MQLCPLHQLTFQCLEAEACLISLYRETHAPRLSCSYVAPLWTKLVVKGWVPNDSNEPFCFAFSKEINRSDNDPGTVRGCAAEGGLAFDIASCGTCDDCSSAETLTPGRNWCLGDWGAGELGGFQLYWCTCCGSGESPEMTMGTCVSILPFVDECNGRETSIDGVGWWWWYKSAGVKNNKDTYCGSDNRRR